jgi:hypothetical protein
MLMCMPLSPFLLSQHRNNDVAMIADGLGVFSEMLLEVSDASEGDMVVGSFWSIGAKYLMSPPLESSSMLSVFGGAQTRGVDTRLLLNDNPTHQCEMQVQGGGGERERERE